MVKTGSDIEFLCLTAVKGLGACAFCVFICSWWLIVNMIGSQAILGGTIRAPGIHGEVELKVSDLSTNSNSFNLELN